MKYISIVLFCLLLLIGGASSTMPKLFYTFANKNEVGAAGYMINDGENYWFSTVWGPLIRYSPEKKEFRRYSFSREQGEIILIKSMALVNKEVWVGLYVHGIAVFTTDSDNFYYYNMDNGLVGVSHGATRYNTISDIAYDKYEKKVWVFSVNAPISVFDLQTKKWSTINEPLIRDIDIASLAVNQEFLVVAAAARNGVYYLDKKNNEWHFCGEPPFTTGKIGLLTDIFIENNRIVFMVRDQKSIVQYDIDTGSYSIIFKWDGMLEGMIKYNNYLILSSDKGVTFYNRKTKKHKTFNKAYGLVSNYVNSVYIEGDDMWVLTREGISKAKMQDVLKELAEIN